MKTQTSRQFLARLAARRFFRLSRTWGIALSTSAVLSVLPSVLRAQEPTTTYTNAAGTATFTTGNFTADPTTYGILAFGTATTGFTVNNGLANLSQNELLFNSANAYTLTGNSISLFDFGGTNAGKIENNSGGSPTTTGLATINLGINFAATSGPTRGEINAITGNIAFGSSGTISITGSGVNGLQLYGGANSGLSGAVNRTVTFGGVISGTGKYFEINGGNTAIFSAANTYTGDTYIYNGSTLQIGTSGSTAGSLDATGTIRLGGDNGSGVTNAAGSATLNLATAVGGQTVASVLNAVGGNANTLLLLSSNTSNTNTYSGNIYLDNNMTVQSVSGGTFALTGSTIDLKNQLLTVNSGGTTNFTGALQNSTGSGSLTKVGAGTLTLSGTNTYTGVTSVNEGTLTLTGSLSSSSTLKVGGGTFNYSKTGANQTLAGLTVSPGSSVINNTVSGTTLALGAISRATAGGIVNFSNPTGTFTTTNANVNNIIGPWASYNNGTSLRYAVSNGGATAISGLTGTTATATTLANVTSATGNYEYSAAATTTTNLTANTLRYSGSASSTTAIGATNTLTLNGLMNAGTGTLTISGGPASGGILIGANNELVILANTQSTAISSVIANGAGGAGSVTYGGPSAGTLALSGANTYSGGTVFGAGTLQLGVSSLLSGSTITSGPVGTGTLSLFSGTTVSSNAVTTAGDRTINNNLSLSGSLTLGNSTNTGVLTFNNTALTSPSTVLTADTTLTTNSAVSIANVISGGFSLTKSGSSTLTLGGANTYTGATTVNNGTLSFTSSLPAGTTVSVTGSGILSETGTGSITGASSYTQSSTGTSVLAGTNSYTGATTVSAGTLSLSGSLTGGNAITVTGTGVFSETSTGSITGAASYTQLSTGSSTLAGTNTYTGTTTVLDGTLTLTGSLSSSTALTLGGGTFTYSKVGTNTQTLAGLTVNPGGSIINNTVGTDTLALGAISRTTANSTLNFGTTTGAITTTSANVNGILGPWASFNNGTNLKYAVSNGGATAITGLTGTTATAADLSNVTSATGNYEYSAAATTTTNLTANTLRYSTGGNTTTTIGASNTLTLNGLMNASVGTLTIAGGPSTGGILIGANNELVIQANTQTTTISSVIANGAAAGSVTYGGPSAGALILSGANTFTGGFSLTSGILDLRNSAALGTGALTSNGLGGGTITRTIQSGLLGGVTLNNNAVNLNGITVLGGAQNIDFGTGAVTLQSASTLSFNNTSNFANFTFGGAITGGPGLTIQGFNPSIANALLTLNGTNTSTPIFINGTAPTVKFGNTNAVPSFAGSVLLNGGAIAVGPGTAFAGATPVATFLADTRVTKIVGAIALTADSSENVTVPNAAITLGAANGSVARYTGTLTPNGAYNVGGGGGTIVFSNPNAFTGTRGLITNNGNSLGNSAFGAGGTTIINGLNNFDGSVNIGAGTLEVTSINAVGSANSSSLGKPTSAANGTIFLGYSGQAFSALRYTGTGDTTDRIFNFNGYSGSTIGLDASGTGALAFTGTFTAASATTNRFLSLRGVNTGANSFAGGIGTQGSNPAGINLTKSQRGNWTLTGTNNFAGTAVSGAGIQVNGGTLTANYNTNANVLGATGTNLTLGGGTLAMVYTGATTAAQSLGNGATTPLVTLSNNSGQSNINVTGNGTTGSAVLTLGANFTRNGGTFLNFNLLSGGQVVDAAATSSNGVIVGVSGTVAAFTVTDASGSDFAALNGSSQIVKLGATTPLPTSGSANTVNYVLTGSQTQGAASPINTLRIAPTANGGTLALGANNGFTSGLSAVSILKDGAFDYTITGTTSLATGGVVLSNFGTGALTVGVTATTGGNNLTKTGPGLVDLTGVQSYTGATNIFGGVLRVSNTIGTGNVTLNTGGIYELGTATNYTAQLGTGTGQVQWGNGDGGFSAAGGNRTVALTNFQGVANGQLVWGTTTGNNQTLVPNSTNNLFVKDGQALLLSSAYATGTVDFQNPIDLTNASRTVEVGKGTASVDAILSGVLSSSDYSGGIYKTGAGVLALTGNNTYTGQTSVTAGTLLVNNTAGSGAGSGAVLVSSGATLGGTGAFTGPVTVNAGGTITGGTRGTGNTIVAGNVGTLSTGALTLTSTAVYNVDIASGVSYDILNVTGTVGLGGSTLTLNIPAGLTLVDGTKLTIIANDGNDPITGTFTGVTEGGTIMANGYTFTTSYIGGTGNDFELTVGVVPEPATWLGGGLLVLGAAWSQRKRFSPQRAA